MNKFSPSCRASMEEHRKQVAEKHAACKTDVEKFCKDKMDGNGGAMRCLHEHKNELSEPCRQSFPSRPPRASSDLPDGHGPGARPGV